MRVSNYDRRDDQISLYAVELALGDGRTFLSVASHPRREDKPRTVSVDYIEGQYALSVGHVTAWLTRSEALTMFSELDKALAR